ncbi:MAG: hypothetical protein LUH20_03765 [Lachnospiraceae bacterium]|nr:hypothetical protein [Lachnospiraceae bacterium]
MIEELSEIEGIQKLLDCCGDDDVMQLFQKKTYTDAFERMYQERISVFDAIEKAYHTAQDQEQYLTALAEALAAYAREKVDACSRKNKKEHLQMDLNMTMAVFVLPMVLEFHGDSSRPLADAMTEAWKRSFPKTNLQAADYRTIEGGFHKTWCYITTAVCRTFDKPDDCYELKTLREYRDTYLVDSPGGRELIEEYYDVAPSIVKHIDQQPDSGAVYYSIWEEWLAPCISMIEAGQNEACREHYTAMVHTLQKKYFRNDPG